MLINKKENSARKNFIPFIGRLPIVIIRILSKEK